MFNSKKKIEFDNEEFNMILYSLIDYRNDVLKANGYTDAFDEVIPRLKNKMKLDKYDLGLMINGLNKKREKLSNKDENYLKICNLLLKLIDTRETIKS